MVGRVEIDAHTYSSMIKDIHHCRVTVLRRLPNRCSQPITRGVRCRYGPKLSLITAKASQYVDVGWRWRETASDLASGMVASISAPTCGLGERIPYKAGARG